MTSSSKLTVNYEEVLFQIDIKHEDTILDLKYSIYTVTGLKPSRQAFPVLDLQGNLENNCKVQLLNLHSDGIVLKVIDKFGNVCSGLTLKLKVEWQNIFFIIYVEEKDTVMDLKFMIFKATGLELSRQSFINLGLCGKVNDNDYAMPHLNLDQQYILKVKEDPDDTAGSLLKKLKVQWENKCFEIDIASEDTILGVKSRIYTATNLEPISQVFLNLSLPDGVKEENCLLEDLNLQSNFLLRICSKLQEQSVGSSTGSATDWQNIHSRPSTSRKSTDAEKQHASTPEKSAKTYHSNGWRELGTPRGGKKLVVLDLDRTVLDYHSSSTRCSARPFLQVFLKGIYEQFDIGVWSATNMDVAVAKLTALNMLSSPHYKIIFCMDVKAMTHVMVNGRHCRVKALRNIWRRYPQYTYRNTVICDDKKMNCLFNRDNGIRVAPYYAQNHGTDNELIHLLAYLKRIGKFEDLTVFDHEQWRNHRDGNSESCSDNGDLDSSDGEDDSDCETDGEVNWKDRN